MIEALAARCKFLRQAKWPAGQLGQTRRLYSPVRVSTSILIENTLLGSLSHDGQTCYFVDDLAVPPHPMQWQNAAMYGGM